MSSKDNETVPELARIQYFPQFSGKRVCPARAAKSKQPPPLKKARSRTKKLQKANEIEYEVEAIVGERTYGKKTQYRVKWRGFPTADNTWEDAVNVEELAALEHYLAAKQGELEGNEQVNESNADEYEVEAIVDQRMIDNQVEYLVKWRGYTVKDQTWEPAEHLKDSAALDVYLTTLYFVK